MDFFLIILIIIVVVFVIRRPDNSFTYKKTNGSWRAYFRGRPSSQSHVLYDNGGYYVCWDRPLRSENEARQVARRWLRIYG